MIFLREKNLPYPQPWEWIKDNLELNGNYFVDVGAFDGLSSSNSAYFEMDLGWDGICIEPHPLSFNKLKKSRKCKLYNCCISNIDGYVDFTVVNGNADGELNGSQPAVLSGITNLYDERHIDRIDDELNNFGGLKQIQKIESKKLSTIFNENNIKHISYLSIDVECGELNVLESIDFDSVDIDIISAENAGYNNLTREYLESKGYQFLTTVCADEIYKKI